MPPLLVPVIALLLLQAEPAPAPPATPAPAAVAVAKPSSACLECHKDSSLTKDGARGAKVSLFVDEKVLKGSPHGGNTCADCHPDVDGANHPGGKALSDVERTTKRRGACLACHTPETGLHAHMLKTFPEVGCASCHGGHAIRKVDRSNAPRCEDCHAAPLRKALPRNGTLSFQITPKLLSGSVHRQHTCQSCHAAFTSKDHPVIKTPHKRKRSLAYMDACRGCHLDKYTRAMEGEHFHLLQKGDDRAPTCADCHGSHEIKAAKRHKADTTRFCKTCHGKIFEAYEQSVHGSALLHGNSDVPACASCHRAHDNQNPLTRDFRSKIPFMCGNCHSNKPLMKKYKLSPDVVKSYLDDFHGVTFKFYSKSDKDSHKIATCVDCHGIHDIKSTKGKNRKEIKQRVLIRCQKCHKDANLSFPDAWVSHWVPSLERAPIVYFINLFYKFLIPMMIIGLALHVLLHLWRYAIRR